MTNKEIRLLLKMLDAYEDHLSVAGCNDTPKEWLEEFTPNELSDIVRLFSYINGDKEDRNPLHMPDYCYLMVIQHKLEDMLSHD